MSDSYVKYYQERARKEQRKADLANYRARLAQLKEAEEVSRLAQLKEAQIEADKEDQELVSDARSKLVKHFTNRGDDNPDKKVAMMGMGVVRQWLRYFDDPAWR